MQDANAQEKPIWELAGIERTAWTKLPWRVMRKHLYRHGRMSWQRYYFPTIPKLWLNFKLWWNEPRGGYLFAAWCRERAERHTIWDKFPNLRIDENDKHYR